MIDVLPYLPQKGRGAVSNACGRFEREERLHVDDGWQSTADHAPEPLRTTVTLEACRSAITRNRSPDVPFDRSINPYRGCEHGCIYCFARTTHAYMGLSPGLDFESRLFAKPNLPAVLNRELRRPGYQCKLMAMGTNTDPYQPIERTYGITRQVIEVLDAFNHPLGIVTKSTLVLRDLDLLARMAARNLAAVAVSITTLDRDLARRMEPRAPTPARRLEAIERLSAAGIPVGVMAAPMIPGLNDSELEKILAAARDAGARRAGYILLRLPLELKDLFAEWLKVHAPHREARVLGHLRAARDGNLYVSRWGSRMRGSGPYADMLSARFQLACRRLSLATGRATETTLDESRFRPPPRPGDQLTLL